ncbi:MAG: hypothetical protein GF349_01285 [Candidatus Magasanikbacteria bacterium]|nr:hypothetical protein [Candidatus Magasanikbacteria bacterium]
MNSKYIFTVGVYKKEMGFYIDFPKFNKSQTSISNYTLPKGKRQIDKIDPSKSEIKEICPKLSFHESGWVLLSKGGVFFDKTISRQKTHDSIFDSNGEHIFTISLQNLNKLPDEPPSTKNKIGHISLPFSPTPKAIKFVGNLWKKEDLKNDFEDFNLLKNGTEFPIVWPRKDGSNLGDIVFILKICHIEKNEPMYLTVRCMPIPLLDKTYIDGTLLTLISGLIFDEVNNLEKETNFISFMAKNDDVNN